VRVPSIYCLDACVFTFKEVKKMSKSTIGSNVFADITAFRTACHLYEQVFEILDSMPELNSEQAGNIAQTVQNVVERELREILSAE
jgi:hypothetical protein